MSESNESSDISDGSNYYSETDISDVSFEDPGIVGLYNNEPEYGEEEIKKTFGSNETLFFNTNSFALHNLQLKNVLYICINVIIYVFSNQFYLINKKEINNSTKSKLTSFIYFSVFFTLLPLKKNIACVKYKYHYINLFKAYLKV